MRTALEKVRAFLKRTRTPNAGTGIPRQAANTALIAVAGFALGLLQKWIDGSASNSFPLWFQQLDIRNYFGRLAIWILLSVIIAVYSASPVRASVNTVSFLLSMVVGYFLYSKLVLGFLSISYMMVWVASAFGAIPLAYVCWYARGNGIFAILVSSVIIGILFAQAFSITQGFRLYHLTEGITWLVGVAVLHRKPKEFAAELALSLPVAFVCQLTLPYFG